MIAIFYVSLFLFAFGGLANERIEGSKRQIFLISDHDHSSTSSDDVYSRIVNLCARKKIVAGLEFLYRDDNSESKMLERGHGIRDKGYCFGIENFKQKLLAMKLKNYLFLSLENDLKDSQKKRFSETTKAILNSLPEENARFIDELGHLDELKALVADFKKTPLPKSIRNFTDQILQYSKLPSFEEIFLATVKMRNKKSWPDFYFYFLNYLIKDKDFTGTVPSEDRQRIASYLMDPKNGNLYNSFSEKLMVDWRDIWMNQNIVKILDLTRKSKLEFYVMIGSSHVPAIKSNLESAGYKVIVLNNQNAITRFKKIDHIEIADDF